MDKQLIERLAREAGMPLVTPYQATEAESAARHNERILGIAERFATLVAEECAKLCDAHAKQCDALMEEEEAANTLADAIRDAFGPVRDLTALAEEIAADDGRLPAGFKGSRPGDFTFRSPPPKDAPTAHSAPWAVATFIRLHSTPPDESGYVTAGHVVVSVKRLAGMSLNEFATLMAESDARAMRLAQGLKG
jgi:hypothetical protein